MLWVSAKTFTTTNLVSHLRTNHPKDFVNLKKRRKAKDRMQEKEMVESGGFSALRQLTLRGSKDLIKV